MLCDYCFCLLETINFMEPLWLYAISKLTVNTYLFILLFGSTSKFPDCCYCEADIESKSRSKHVVKAIWEWIESIFEQLLHFQNNKWKFFVHQVIDYRLISVDIVKYQQIIALDVHIIVRTKFMLLLRTKKMSLSLW